MRVLRAFSLLACLLAGCSEAPSPAATVDYHFEFTTQPGTETYWCQFVEVPADGLQAAGFRWETTSFHHWALFRTSGLDPATVDVTSPFECFGSPETQAAAPASIVSQPTTDQTALDFPPGYAVPFAPGEILMLQAHTVNASSTATTAELDLSIRQAEGSTAALGEYQFYDPFIVVPPLGVGEASMRCQVPQDVDIVYMTTHQHTRGTDFTVYLDPPGGPESTMPLLQAGSWEEPATRTDLLHVPAGSQFRVYCGYADKSGEGAYQGPNKFTDEMCQLYGFYAPPVPGPGAVLWEACVPSFVAGGTGDMHGTGSATCADTLFCVSACAPGDAPRIVDGKFEVGPCWQECVVSSCPSAGELFNAAFACLSAECATECGSGAADPACQACVGDRCAGPAGACQAAACAP